MKITEKLLDIDVIDNSNKNLLDMFIRRTGVITSTPEDLVDKIIRGQWREANKATRPESDIGEVDICNIGTFYMSPSKGRRKISKLKRYIEDIILHRVNRTKGSDSEVLSKNYDIIESIRIKIKDE